MQQYALLANLSTAPKDRDALVEILTQAVKIMETVDGCLQYILFKDADNDELVWISEIWESKAAHEASLTREDVRVLIGQAIPLLKAPPEAGIQLIPIVGKGL